MGGVKYFCFMPDGKAYRCYSDAMLRKEIGYVWNVKPKDKPEDCNDVCLSCALDHKNRIRKLKEYAKA